MATATLAPARLRRLAPRTPGAPSPLVLPIILLSYLMIILDASVVITALPEIRSDLGFSATGLSWVQNAYTLTFGGLLLLGARTGDILGRRRMLMAGIAVFTAASFMGGLAPSAELLLVARAIQGLGAAIAAPSTLALLTTTFREGAERTRAVAAYAAVAGGGGSIGLVLGGMLTSWISWRWGLFINVPVGAALLVLIPRHVTETEPRPGHFDLAGAATSILGMSSLVYGFVRAAEAGWGDDLTLGAFAAAAVLLAAFVATELRAEQPITPLRLFASRERSGAYAARLLVVGAMFGMFFFVSQYLQGVRGFDPLTAGLAFLPMTAVMFATVRTVPRLVGRFGNLAVLTGGLVVAAGGMAWISRLELDTAYAPQIALPLVLLGLGMGAAFAPLTSAGIAGVRPDDAGAAAGLVNVAQQLGGSVGLGLLVTRFASAASDAASHPLAGADRATEARSELAHGVQAALTGSAVLLVLALLVVATVMLRRPARERAAVGDAIVAD